MIQNSLLKHLPVSFNLIEAMKQILLQILFITKDSILY